MSKLLTFGRTRWAFSKNVEGKLILKSTYFPICTSRGLDHARQGSLLLGFLAARDVMFSVTPSILS